MIEKIEVYDVRDNLLKYTITEFWNLTLSEKKISDVDYFRIEGQTGEFSFSAIDYESFYNSFKTETQYYRGQRLSYYKFFLKDEIDIIRGTFFAKLDDNLKYTKRTSVVNLQIMDSTSLFILICNSCKATIANVNNDNIFPIFSDSDTGAYFKDNENINLFMKESAHIINIKNGIDFVMNGMGISAGLIPTGGFTVPIEETTISTIKPNISDSKNFGFTGTQHITRMWSQLWDSPVVQGYAYPPAIRMLIVQSFVQRIAEREDDSGGGGSTPTYYYVLRLKITKVLYWVNETLGFAMQYINDDLFYNYSTLSNANIANLNDTEIFTRALSADNPTYSFVDSRAIFNKKIREINSEEMVSFDIQLVQTSTPAFPPLNLMTSIELTWEMFGTTTVDFILNGSLESPNDNYQIPSTLVSDWDNSLSDIFKALLTLKNLAIYSIENGNINFKIKPSFPFSTPTNTFSDFWEYSQELSFIDTDRIELSNIIRGSQRLEEFISAYYNTIRQSLKTMHYFRTKIDVSNINNYVGELFLIDDKVAFVTSLKPIIKTLLDNELLCDFVLLGE